MPPVWAAGQAIKGRRGAGRPTHGIEVRTHGDCGSAQTSCNRTGGQSRLAGQAGRLSTPQIEDVIQVQRPNRAVSLFCARIHPRCDSLRRCCRSPAVSLQVGEKIVRPGRRVWPPLMESPVGQRRARGRTAEQRVPPIFHCPQWHGFSFWREGLQRLVHYPRQRGQIPPRNFQMISQSW